MNKPFYFMFSLTDDGTYALGGDDQTPLLLKLRRFSLQGVSEDGQWFVVQRCSSHIPKLIKAIEARDIELSEDAIAELQTMPEDFWVIPLATQVSVIQEFA